MRPMPSRHFDAADTVWPASDFDAQSVGDHLEACVLRLQCAGFLAEVRSYGLEMNVTRRSVAVYVHRHDPRVSWSSARADGVPAALPYRDEGRHGHAFSLFSGEAPDDVAKFERVLMQRRAADALCISEPSSCEWDPHQLASAEQSWVEAHVQQVRWLVEASPVMPPATGKSRPRRP